MPVDQEYFMDEVYGYPEAHVWVLLLLMSHSPLTDRSDFV